MSEWISIEDRVPLPDEQVLVCGAGRIEPVLASGRPLQPTLVGNRCHRLGNRL